MHGEWQPIETAPRTGEWVLAIIAGWWMPGVPFRPTVTYWGADETRRGGGQEGWLTPSDEAGCATLTDIRFTHWMPLPEPPAPPEKECI